MKNLFLILLITPLLFTACEDETETMIVDPTQPQGEFEVSRSGSFVDQNDAGSTGNAELGTDSEDQEFLRFNDSFNTAIGTGTVTVYLSTSETFTADPMNGNPDLLLIGPVRNQGENFFEIPEGESTSKYTHVILWCNSVSIPFGYAELN
jgi:hypothetical protein